MAVQTAFQDVGEQHGVVERRDIDAVAMQHRQVVFQVLPDLEDTRVFQQRLQRGDHLVQRDLLQLIAAEIQPLGGVADRNVTGMVRAGR